jgi:hypothetical protein
VGAGAASASRQDDRAGQADYARAGMAFRDWFDEKLGQLPNATMRLGVKNATAVRLHADGRLDCWIRASAGEEEKTFVAFEASYLDQLIRKSAAIGL